MLNMTLSAYCPVANKFTAAEQQQISIATPGLFDRSQAFNIDFGSLKDADYSFPLPVGKARAEQGMLRISTKKGDAVKAMFAGVVRLSRQHPDYGNVIVVRHNNGLETVYTDNAQNLLHVGDRVKAGQTLAIVGSKNGKVELGFFIMVNGGRINPETLIDIRSHKLRRQVVLFKKNGNRVDVAVTGSSRSQRASLSLDPDTQDDPFENSTTFKLDLTKIEQEHWAYPLPGAKVISPYGGRRNHAGVDIKTKPNDHIVAAFDGVVTRSSPYSGYGNCIIIRHAYGFETLYSHQSRNFVKVGQKVKAGQVIGLTGRTGRATTEHLHFEVHFRGRRFNPAILFDHTNRRLQAKTLRLSKSGSIRTEK